MFDNLGTISTKLCVCASSLGCQEQQIQDTPSVTSFDTFYSRRPIIHSDAHTKEKRGSSLSTTIPLLFPNMHAHMSNYIVCSLSSGFNTSSHNTWIVLPLCVALPASCPCHHEKCFLYFNTMKHRTYSKRWWFTMRALPVICKINATGRPSVLQNILSSKRTGMVLKTIM